MSPTAENFGPRIPAEDTRQALGTTADHIEKIFADAGVDLLFDVRSDKMHYRLHDSSSVGDLPPTKWWEPLAEPHQAAMRDWAAIQYQLAGVPGSTHKRGNWKISKDAWFDKMSVLSLRLSEDLFLRWIEELPDWDGKPRVETLLADYLGANADDQFVRWASRYPFVGALQRAYMPGCELKELPVWVGPQNAAKSTLCHALIPERWFADTVRLCEDQRRLIEKTQGRVIVEISELAGSNKGEIEEMKAYLGSRVDAGQRLAYDREPTDWPRRFILIGTANQRGIGVLPNDSSGSTRFVVVETPGVFGHKRRVPTEWEIRQLWAEAALKRAVEGDEWRNANLPWQLHGERDERNSKHIKSDVIVEDELRKLAPGEYSMAELCCRLGLDKPSVRDQHRVGEAAVAVGMTQKRRIVDGRKVRLWEKLRPSPDHEKLR